jgi:HNH endonuclease
MNWEFVRKMSDKRVTIRQRTAVFERANGCCEYCLSQEKYAPETFSTDHIIPRAKEGKTTLDNLALACQGCNSYKYTRTFAIDLVTGNKTPLFHPRKHIWHEHFAWSDDLIEIIGLTPIGRVTVAMLQLNREGLVNLRGVLLVVHKHPPQ